LITLFDTYFVPKVFLAIFLPFLQFDVALWQKKVSGFKFPKKTVRTKWNNQIFSTFVFF